MAALKLLVIAAAGGLGREVVREALLRGHAVSVLVRSPAKLQEALGGAVAAQLAGVHTGSGESAADVAAAAAGAHAIISAGPPIPAMARVLGEACRASATCKAVVWTAGASNLLEADGVTPHHLAYGPRGMQFYSAHAPCIAALLETKAPFIIWCPGFMKALGKKSASPVAISTRAVPGSVKAMDFVSYEDAANAIVRAVEVDTFLNEHITALSEQAQEL
jgi:putative NADH-flavin reductase